MPEINDVNLDLRNALLLYQYAFLRREPKLKEMIVRWIIGEKIYKKEYKWINKHVKDLSINHNINDESSFDMFKNLSKISKLLGFNGLMILLDEAERLPEHKKRCAWIY